MQDDWATILPAPDAVKETARALLELAVSPHDVRTAGTGTEFRVPLYLAELYHTPPTPKKRVVKKKEGDEQWQ